MSASMLGRRYARAVVALAKEAGELPKVREDFVALQDAWQASPELRAVFENPKLGAEARRAVIEGLAARLGLHPVVVRTLKLLSDRRRLGAFPDIAEAVFALAEESAGQQRAEVTTARDMPDAYYEELQRALERAVGKKLVLVKRTDPNLIGGVVARVGDRVFDGSVKNRLAELRGALLLN